MWDVGMLRMWSTGSGRRAILWAGDLVDFVDLLGCYSF